MRRKQIKQFLQLAAQKAISSPNHDDLRRNRIGSVGITLNGNVIFGKNKSYIGKCAKSHAEIALLDRLEPNSTIFVARKLRSNQEFALSRPCVTCLTSIKNARIGTVYYSIDEIHYGKMSIHNKQVHEQILPFS